MKLYVEKLMVSGSVVAHHFFFIALSKLRKDEGFNEKPEEVKTKDNSFR